jgi:hypothetical protein
VPFSIWGNDPERLTAVRILEKVAQEVIWVEKVSFIPNDPFDIVFNLTIGDLCEVAAMQDLGDKFKIKILDDKMLLEKLYKATMSEAVDIFIGLIPHSFIMNQVDKEWKKRHKKSIFNLISKLLGNGRPSKIRVVETSKADIENYFCEGEIQKIWEYGPGGYQLIFTLDNIRDGEDVLETMTKLLDGSGMEQCTFSMDEEHCVVVWSYLSYEGKRPKKVYRKGSLYRRNDASFEGVNCWID